ncbi:MAG: hypothetical protein LJE70_08425 [Chromatiaceae bacterium]|nr:hypothetical protein [Chromatiaceae bacterium]
MIGRPDHNRRSISELNSVSIAVRHLQQFCPLRNKLEETVMKRFLVLFLLACSLPVDAEAAVAEFYPDAAGGAATCDGDDTNPALPIKCPFKADGVLVFHLESWGEGGTATITIEKEGQNATVSGICADAFNPDDGKFPTYQFHPGPDCLNPNAGPPRATGEQIFEEDCKEGDCPAEWYTDLPWNQKLSTLNSNKIDVPFVLPCAALSDEYRPKTCCSKGEVCDEVQETEMARKMLRYGIANVMAIQRTDTVYKDGEGPTPNDCKGAPSCVEVKLRIQRLHTQTDNDKGYEADEITNDRYEYKNQAGDDAAIPSLGFAVTEATIFAPMRIWPTGHYCAKLTDSISTSICYDDYWTTGLVAPATVPKQWLSGVWTEPNQPTPFRPALFWPRGEPKTTFQDFCQARKTDCNMFLGKVGWLENAKKPEVTGCKGEDLSVCQNQIRNDLWNLDSWFSKSLTEYEDLGAYPWSPPLLPIRDPNDLSTGEENYNPFIGFYKMEASETNTVDDKNPFNTKYKFKSPYYVLPKKCTTDDYRLARQGELVNINRLSDCAVNFEIHTSGFQDIWKDLYGVLDEFSEEDIDEMIKALNGLTANQYGRTMFLYGGLREQHVPVSFFKTLDEGMSIHDKVYSGGPYVQYLPMVNPADRTLKWTIKTDDTTGQTTYDPLKNYKDDFWHAFFMSNHMNQDPDHFIRGIRGRTLWHNEYRSWELYHSNQEGLNKDTKFQDILGHVDFPAGFQTSEATAPFHGNTCDACHVRNGSGIPLMPNGKLPKLHAGNKDDERTPKPLMNEDYHVRAGQNQGDYTYTNIAYPDKNDPKNSQEVPSMKMVFFDLRKPDPTDGRECDDDHNSVEINEDNLYRNKIMNFYGNSLQLDQNGHHLTYDMKYVDLKEGDGFVVVEEGDDIRGGYQPKRVEVVTCREENQEGACTSGIKADDVCGEGYIKKWMEVEDVPEYWPTSCTQVDGAAIMKAIEEGRIGYMHLTGRRLGNTPLIEMIPDAEILEARKQQEVPGCLSLAPGTRRGTGEADYHYRTCELGKLGDGPGDCYIGRWGWIGDRASLEDQVANAADVEMSISSSRSYDKIHPSPTTEAQLVRYKKPQCGPLNTHCKVARTNSDITEQEIRDMATYQRWIGIPNRSEYEVSSMQVQEGEKIFEELQCNSCHVIKKIPFDYADNMLPDEERKHLKAYEIFEGDKVEYPFVAYLGTDLLMHDMGYLSQVAPVPLQAVENHWFRDKESGKVESRYRNYVQFIRTPALKGLRFNRFVTDSNHNTTGAEDPLGKNDPDGHNFTPGCDFLLHDGRACDAIEAAFLHDGPLVKASGMIGKLNALSPEDLDRLRAFLYSL